MTFRTSKPGRGTSKLFAVAFFAIALYGLMLIWAPRGVADPVEQTTVTAGTAGVEQTSGYTPLHHENSITHYLWKVVFVTTAIIGLFWLLAKFYRQKMMPGTGSGTQFTILGREYLTPKNSLVMVKVEERKLLVGVSESSLNLIAEFENNEEFETDVAAPVKSDGTFQSLLNKVKGTISPSGDQS